MHKIALTSDKRLVGIRTWPVTEATMFEVMPVHEALESDFTTDAHFVCYTVRDADGLLYSDPRLPENHQWPRINKTALPALRKVGCEVLNTMLVFDYDLPHDAGEKVAWTTETYKTFLDETLPILRRRLGPLFATYVYLTNHGARFIHLLTEPVPGPESEGYWAALFNIYEEAGVKMDPACRDYTRLFRLPRVQRDGKSTWTGFVEQFGLVYDPDNFIVPDADLEPVEWAHARDYSTYLEVRQETADTPMPTLEVAMKLLRTNIDSPGRMGFTAAYKAAKDALQGRASYPILFEKQPLGAAGERDNRLTSLVGEVCRLLVAYNQRTDSCTFRAEHIYALFLETLDDLKPDAGTPSWHESAWDKILRFWVVSDAQGQAEQAEQEERAQDSADVRLDGLRSWTDHPDVHSPDEARALEAMCKNLILLTPAGDLVMLDKTGHYTRPVSKTNVYATLENLGLAGDLVRHATIAKDGSQGVLLKVPELLMYYGSGTTITDVSASVAHDRSIIEQFGTDQARLVYPIACLNPQIDACCMEEVDRWLLHMIGKDHIEKFKKWIAYALDFRAGPIAALALIGPPGIGKKLLVQGLAECFLHPVVVPGVALIDTFQKEMTQSIIISVDEGLPKDTVGVKMAFKDRIRMLVAGDPFTCGIKHKDSVKVRAAYRILLTANNSDIVDGLIGLDLAHHDPEAIGSRILRFTGKRQAADYLLQIGTREKRWISGDGGKDSKFVIARHFMWLHEHKEDFGAPEERFLVRGNAYEEIRRSLVQSTIAQPILGAITDLLIDQERMRKQLTASNTAAPLLRTLKGILHGIAIKDGHFWISQGALAGFCDYRGIPPLSTKHNVFKALKNFAPEGLESTGSVRSIQKKIMTLAGEERSIRWWPIDVDWLRDYAFESGVCDPVEITVIIEKGTPA